MIRVIVRQACTNTEDVGGTLEIATRPDGGTHSRVVLPSRLGHWTNSQVRKREWPRSKRPEPFGGRMFYYVLDSTRLTCFSSGKRTPRNAVAAAIGGEGGKHGLAHLVPQLQFSETSAIRRSFSLTAVGARSCIEQPSIPV